MGYNKHSSHHMDRKKKLFLRGVVVTIVSVAVGTALFMLPHNGFNDRFIGEFNYSLIKDYSYKDSSQSGSENDQAGNIVFTSSVGLKGVGVDKKVWESIRNQKEGETYTHTIDPSKSELYGGQQVTYYAPYTKCDRIEDYRRAWAHYEKVFKDK